MQIFLTTINPGTYTFFDLGGYSITHPVGPIPLIEPQGEFTQEDIQISEDLLLAVQAGDIELTNEGGDTITSLNDLQTANPGLYVSLTETESIGGQKSFTTGLDVVGTTDYELSVTNDDDIPNKKYVDDAISGATVTEVNDLTAAVTWANVPDANITQSSVTQHEAAIDHDALTNFVANEHIDWTAPGAGTIDSSNINFPPETNDLSSAVTWTTVPNAFISQGSVTQHESAINHDNLLGFVANEHIDWTVDQGATNINAANIELSFDDLTDVDTTTLPPQNGDLLYFNGGGNWIPADNATDRVSLFTNGCIAEFQDTTGLDFCNHQIGPVAGSAFYIAKRSLGTLASPTAVTDGTKIGGYAFLANDGVTTGPGYVGAEISSSAKGDQDAVNGGANIWFNVTQQGTKTSTLALEIEDDGTLSVAGQTDYELKVLDDDDIPNRKFVLDQLAVASELPTIAVRRTTSLNPIPTTWTDFDWDTQDVTSSNTSVIDYTGTPADEIQIGEAGLYLISWAISADDEVEVRLTNNGVVIPGSFHTTGDKTDANQILTGNEKVIARNLNVGTLVLQVEAITTAEFTIADSATFSVVRLKGTKGENGDPGVQGPPGNDGADGADGQDGPPGFGIYAWADVTGATGVENDGLGLSVVRTGTGTYQYTFDQALANTNYAVIPRAYDAGATDFNTFVNNRTLSGFTVTMGIGDNGGTADVLTDADHTVAVIGPGAGAPSGSNLVNVRLNGTPVVDTPHGTLNFSSDFTATNAGGGIVDIGSNIQLPPFSVLKTKSQAADQATNYNIAGPEVALVLTGTTTILGDGATDFTNASGTYTCNFTGSVRVTFGVPYTSTGARSSLKSIVQQNTGGGFTNVGSPAYGYIRNSSGHTFDNNSVSEVFTCNTGDQFRVGMRRAENASNTAAINILDLTFIQIERLS